MKTVRIELELPSDTQLSEVCAAIRNLGCDIRQKQDGTLHGFPISPDRHGNQGVIRFPHYRRQIGGLVTTPEDAA